MNAEEKNGYCMICSTAITYNINTVLCNDCARKSLSKYGNWINGDFCHICGSKNKKISNHYPLCIDCRPFDRNDNSIDAYYLINVKKYRELPFSDRKKIKPLWKSDQTKIKLGLEHFSLMSMKTSQVIELIKQTTSLKTSIVFDNEPKNNRRIMNALRAWEQGIYLMPPVISKEDRIALYDGNHRSLAAHYLEVQFIYVYLKTGK